MTLDQAVAHLEGQRRMHIGNAESIRKLAEDYRRAANAADDVDLRTQHFESSSRLLADARSLDRDAEAIWLVLGGLR